MDLPRSCTDLAIALPCPACNGNGGHGVRSEHGNPFTNCKTCTGTGWQIKRPHELTDRERTKLLAKLDAKPA